jgi:hypothetical protein
VGFCEHDKEPSVSKAFFDQMNNCQLLKGDPASWKVN